MLEHLLEVVAAAYRCDGPTERWLAGIVHAVDEAFCAGARIARWRGGRGVCAFTYRVGIDHRVSVLESFAKDLPDRSRDLLVGLPPTFPASYVRNTFQSELCGLASMAGGRKEQAATRKQLAWHRPSTGWHDLLVVNGVDATNHGVWVGIPVFRAARLPDGVLAPWTHVAVHLAAAMRLRGRAAPRVDEAVLDPGGAVVHARGVATARASRRALADAVRALESLRAGSRRSATGRPLATWKGLVDARWTLVDHFERAGKRFVVATCNDVEGGAPGALGRRERQVLAFAALGHSNKLIAYELGLSPSTVAVFLHRAMRKMRVGTRAEMMAEYRRTATEVATSEEHLPLSK